MTDEWPEDLVELPLADGMKLDRAARVPEFVPDAPTSASQRLNALEEMLKRKIPLEQEIAKLCENETIGALKVGKGKKARAISGTLPVEKWRTDYIDDIIEAVKKTIKPNVMEQAKLNYNKDARLLVQNLETFKEVVNEESQLLREHGIMPMQDWLALRNKVKTGLGISAAPEIIGHTPHFDAKEVEAARKIARIERHAPRVAEFKINIGKAYEELGAVDKTLEDTYRALAKAAGSTHAADGLLLEHMINGPAGIPADLADNVRHALDARLAAQGKEADLLEQIHALKGHGASLTWAEGESCKALVDTLENGRNTATEAYRTGLDAEIEKTAQALKATEAAKIKTTADQSKRFIGAVQKQHTAQEELIAAIRQLPDKGPKGKPSLRARMLEIVEQHTLMPREMHAALLEEIKQGNLFKGGLPIIPTQKMHLSAPLANFYRTIHETDRVRDSLGKLVEAEHITTLELHAKDAAKLGTDASVVLHGNLDKAGSLEDVLSHLKDALKPLEQTTEQGGTKAGKGGAMKWVIGGAVAVVGALGIGAVLNNKPRTQIGERQLVAPQLDTTTSMAR